jgi:hypothetical protein
MSAVPPGKHIRIEGRRRNFPTSVDGAQACGIGNDAVFER